MPFDPEPLDIRTVIGRPVDEVTLNAGTYGAGGYGFFALRFEAQWLVIAVAHADGWVYIDDKLARDWATGPHRQGAAASLTSRLRGSTITSMAVDRTSLDMRFSNGATLVIHEDPSRRPVHEGSKEPRALNAEDDLQRAVFLAPTAELWSAGAVVRRRAPKPAASDPDT
jgi:hypothetical protein